MCIYVFDSDTVAERSALMENVYPRLYLYCKQRGYEFSMVDLRLGVGTPIAEHHDTVELHVENLQQCQKTQGPNLIVRYHPVRLFDGGTVIQMLILCSVVLSGVCRTEV